MSLSVSSINQSPMKASIPFASPVVGLGTGRIHALKPLESPLNVSTMSKKITRPKSLSLPYFPARLNRLPRTELAHQGKLCWMRLGLGCWFPGKNRIPRLRLALLASHLSQFSRLLFCLHGTVPSLIMSPFPAWLRELNRVTIKVKGSKPLQLQLQLRLR